jgi:hypothetical protein
MAHYRWFLFTGTFLLLAAGLPDAAAAWGPGIHIFINRTILDTGCGVNPALLELLRAFSLDFLYGGIIADFFIGKGWFKKINPENWGVGFSLLAHSRSENELAFSHGFLSHLAADVIAHNYFIPTFIHTRNTTAKLGHLSCEIAADNLVRKQVKADLAHVFANHDRNTDAFLLRHTHRRPRFFGLRKILFFRSITFSHLSRYQKLVQVQFKLLRKKPTHDEISHYLEYSLGASCDVLNHGHDSPICGYIPGGFNFLKLSRKLGRHAAGHGTGTADTFQMFPIPETFKPIACRIGPVTS